jgi:hypothetical protein
MATRDDLRTEVRDLLGEAVASNWTDAELDRHLVQSIRKVRDSVPLDALLSLRYEYVYTTSRHADNSGIYTAYLSKPSGIYKLIKILSEESDGKYGNPWTYVSEEEFWRIRRNEDDSEYDSTDTRIFTDEATYLLGTSVMPLYGSGYFWKLYPYPSSYYVKIIYIAKPSESGTMTLPTDDPNLQYPVVIDVTAKAAAKKSRDLELARWARDEFNSVIGLIRKEYTNRYGLTPAEIGTIGD